MRRLRGGYGSGSGSIGSLSNSVCSLSLDAASGGQISRSVVTDGDGTVPVPPQRDFASEARVMTKIGRSGNFPSQQERWRSRVAAQNGHVTPDPPPIPEPSPITETEPPRPELPAAFNLPDPPSPPENKPPVEIIVTSPSKLEEEEELPPPPIPPRPAVWPDPKNSAADQRSRLMKEIMGREMAARIKLAEKGELVDDEARMVMTTQQVINQTSRVATINSIPAVSTNNSHNGDERQIKAVNAESKRVEYLKQWEDNSNNEKAEEERLKADIVSTDNATKTKQDEYVKANKFEQEEARKAAEEQLEKAREEEEHNDRNHRKEIEKARIEKEQKKATEKARQLKERARLEDEKDKQQQEKIREEKARQEEARKRQERDRLRQEKEEAKAEQDRIRQEQEKARAEQEKARRSQEKAIEQEARAKEKARIESEKTKILEIARQREAEMKSLKAEEQREAARLKEIEARRREVEEELERERRHLEELQNLEQSLRALSPRTPSPTQRPKAALQYEDMVYGRAANRSPATLAPSPTFEMQEKQRIADLLRIKELKAMEEQKMRELSMLQNARKIENLSCGGPVVIIPVPMAFTSSSSSCSPDPLNSNGRLITALPPLPPIKARAQELYFSSHNILKRQFHLGISPIYSRFHNNYVII
jgi:hypothetical protein